jgi:AraC family transcriptional regulator of adaptative response / DNA-3-methyladenine glycosylase II
MLDFDICNEARLRRDPAFDGVFFIGVKTTGIYCRPVCPARSPLTRNIGFYPSAAAAEAAGFRPCLRCRPETAPFSPAWNGTKTTVERALRLIADGALDDGTVEALAGRLGVGPRHLTRLFRQHVGASPVQVAKTARVQRAKRLIDRGELTMAEIARTSGFGSLRRFNTVFLELYGRPPSAMRRTRARAGPRPSPPQDAHV